MKKSMILIAAISLFFSMVAQARTNPVPRIPRDPDSDSCPNGQIRDSDGRCMPPRPIPYQPR